MRQMPGAAEKRNGRRMTGRKTRLVSSVVRKSKLRFVAPIKAIPGKVLAASRPELRQTNA
jgi:hypothetical protein